MRKPGNQEEEFIHGFMDSLSACWRRCASSFIEVAADVRRLTIFDLRYTIYARRRNRGRLVNRKSKIVNSVRASSRRLLPDAGGDASSQCHVRSTGPASVRFVVIRLPHNLCRRKKAVPDDWVVLMEMVVRLVRYCAAGI